MKSKEIVEYLTQLLNVNNINDYCPNGLQVEGKSDISKIITGVTASEMLIDAAIEQNADAILVHHGYFWKGESQVITGLKKNRLAKLLKHNINLLAYHLPIDVHPELGNNAQLADLLGITNVTPVDGIKPKGVLMRGELVTPMSIDALGQLINQKLQRQPLINNADDKLVSSIAWCTGGGQGYIDKAAELGVDAFLTGEASEQTIHSSREFGIHFIAAGHHATERYGVKALGEHLADKFDLDIEFIDIHNPV